MFTLKIWQWALLLFIITMTQNIAHAQETKLSDNINTASCTSPLQEVLPASLFNSQHSKTTQLRDGSDNPTRQVQITIPLQALQQVELCKTDGITIEVKVRDPAPNQDVFLSVELDSITLDEMNLQLVVNGPVSEGSLLTLDQGVLLVDGKSNTAGTVELSRFTLESVKKTEFPEHYHALIDRYNQWLDSYNTDYSPALITPVAATFWFKALAPIDENKSQFLSYGVSNSVDADLQPTEFNTVFNNLKAHFDKKIEVGLLTQERAEEVLAMFDDSAVHEVFTDINGELNTHLMASTLATAGTVLDGAMEVFLGDNDTGMPAKVFYGLPPTGDIADAQVLIIDGEMNVIIRDGSRFASFQLVGTLLGHEAFHQEPSITQNEELIASVAQYVAYAQQILFNPNLATDNLFSAHINNTALLMLMNSGKSRFPNAGMKNAPTMQAEIGLGNLVLPDGSSAPFKSFKDWRIQAFYSNTPLGNSPGNNYLRRVAAKISGGHIFPQLDFDEEGIAVFDNIRVLTPEQWNQVAHTLKLSFDPNVIEPEK